MKVLKLIKAGSFTSYGKKLVKDETATFTNDQADYLLSTGYFELIEEVKGKRKPSKKNIKEKE